MFSTVLLSGWREGGRRASQLVALLWEEEEFRADQGVKMT